MNILYSHGFGSSGQSSTVEKLEECRRETEKGTICNNLLNSLRE